MNESMSDPAIAASIIGVLLFFAVLTIIPQIFFLLTLQKCLTKIKENNRAMSPSLVWLNMIPIFSMAWNFYIVIKMKESISNEYKERGWPQESDYGYGVGLAMSILACVGIIPMIGIIAGVACLVVWIIYWIKIAEYSKKLDEQGIINV